MTAPDKRARKKQHRDEMLAAQQAALSRRRNIRLIGVLTLLVLLVGGAIFFSNDEQDEPSPPAAQEEQEQEQDAATAEAACGAEAPPPPDPKTNYKKPQQVTENGVDYGAVIQTSCGEIVIDLLEDRAPKSVNNFVFLAREGYYDGLIWHRVESNSVLQTGDPNGQNGVPPDGPGYEIPDELPEKSNEYVYGVVGMANAGPGTGGSQFFIVIQKNRPAGYQPFYSIFGEVVEGETDATEEEIGCNPAGSGGIPTLEAIGCQPTNTGAADGAEAVKPLVPVFIEGIEITEA
ncbi:MAG TPA: peptidylprolyl isomerase [Actinomycetota bacterium]|nr:peptidylprolyl isomerase [Actinomycetota bacterium]